MMNRKSLWIFTIFSLLYVFIGVFLLDGGLVFISVLLTSSYIILANLLGTLFNKKMSDFWVGFIISLLCLISPLALSQLLKFYSFCR